MTIQTYPVDQIRQHQVADQICFDQSIRLLERGLDTGSRGKPSSPRQGDYCAFHAGELDLEARLVHG